MESSQIILLAIVGLLVLLFMRRALIRRAVPSCTPARLEQAMNASPPPVLLDVRTRGERNEQHIRGSVHIPIGELNARLGELEKYRSKNIVCYCQSGSRSLSAALLLKKNGFRVENLEGGIGAWNYHRLARVN